VTILQNPGMTSQEIPENPPNNFSIDL